MESKIADIHVQLKKQDPKLLFQFSRSCDFRICKCQILQDVDGRLAKSVATMIEHGSDNGQPFPECIYNAFFKFSEPVQINPDLYETSIRGLPSRKLKIHMKNKKYYVTTDIAGVPDRIILGVHITVDFVSCGPPLLRGILLVGLEKSTKSYVSEHLPIAPYLRDIASMLGNYVLARK